MHRVLAVPFAAMVFACASQAATITYYAVLSGVNESPPNNSPATGVGYVTVDDVALTMIVDVTFAGLVAPNTAAHIHCCTAAPFTGTAGVATTTPTFTGFPSGTTSGSYNHTFDLTLASSYNAAFVTANGNSVAAAGAALLGGMAAGTTYLNIHSSTFPNGEIRGFLAPVPEPATFMVAGVALLGLAAICRRRGI